MTETRLTLWVTPEEYGLLKDAELACWDASMGQEFDEPAWEATLKKMFGKTVVNEIGRQGGAVVRLSRTEWIGDTHGGLYCWRQERLTDVAGKSVVPSHETELINAIYRLRQRNTP